MKVCDKVHLIEVGVSPEMDFKAIVDADRKDVRELPQRLKSKRDQIQLEIHGGTSTKCD
jgi:hypothetical protein